MYSIYPKPYSICLRGTIGLWGPVQLSQKLFSQEATLRVNAKMKLRLVPHHATIYYSGETRLSTSYTNITIMATN